MQGYLRCIIFDNYIWSSFLQYIFVGDSLTGVEAASIFTGLCFDAEDYFLIAEGGLRVGVVCRIERDGDFLWPNGGVCGLTL